MIVELLHGADAELLFIPFRVGRVVVRSIAPEENELPVPSGTSVVAGVWAIRSRGRISGSDRNSFAVARRLAAELPNWSPLSKQGFRSLPGRTIARRRTATSQ